MRLDKAVSLAGVSRSEAKDMIRKGRVKVNGLPALDPGMNVKAEEVCVDGGAEEIREDLYIMVNKPKGMLTATEDKHLPTVVDLLPEKFARRRIGPVGRLDRDVTGLVLLTTDGQLAHRLISPKFGHEKLYRAVCEGLLTEKEVRLFDEGLDLGDFISAPAKLGILESSDTQSTADVILTEGKFHEVKRMFAAAGHPLISLKRLRIGSVVLDEGLPEGGWRHLTDNEVEGLKKITSL